MTESLHMLRMLVRAVDRCRKFGIPQERAERTHQLELVLEEAKRFLEIEDNKVEKALPKKPRVFK